MEKSIGSIVEKSLEERKTRLEKNTGTYEICRDLNETYGSFVVAPIVAGGDPIGSVILVTKNESTKMGDLETKMAETAAGFLAKQMEQ